MHVVVLGIGNILLSDEAVGVRAVEALSASYDLPHNVEVIDGGTSAMELLDELANASLLIVVDAVYAGKAPGETVRLAGAEVPVFFRSKLSPHQISLSDVLASLEFAGQLPAETVILGVQPQSFALSLDMTPLVASRVPMLVDMVVAELRNHGIDARSRTAAA
jgi:hydrogenase maturation protease